MSKVAKTTFYLMVVTLIAKVLGMGRELVLSSVYGTGLYTEVYLTSMNIPNIIFAAVGTAIVTTFIPMYQEISSNQGEDRAIKFLNNVLNIVVSICIIVSILGIIFSNQLVSIFAIGFEGERFLLTVKFTKILIVGIIFISLSSVMSAFLQIKNKFIVVGFGSVPYNIIIIISILLSTKLGPYTMPIGALFAMAIQTIYYLVFVRNTNYRYIRSFDIKDDNLKILINLLGPVLLGVAVNQINSLIDTTLASTLSSGSIPALSYANRLNGFVLGIFIASVVSVVYPMLSRLSAEDNREKFIASVTSSVNIIIVLMIPISIGSIVLSKPIVRIIFERGAFDTNATNMTAIALIFYSLGMLAFGLRDILSKIFYSLQDTKTPMKNGIISVGINIFLNLILIKPMGYAGLAFATSLSSSVCIVIMFISLKKKMGYFGQDKIIKTTFKSIISSIIMGFGVYVTYNILINYIGINILEESKVVLLSILVGVVIYGFMIMLFKVDEVSTIIKMIKNKVKYIVK